MFPADKAAPHELPFVAPCHELKMDAPIRWLRLAWTDIKTAPNKV